MKRIEIVMRIISTGQAVLMALSLSIEIVKANESTENINCYDEPSRSDSDSKIKICTDAILYGRLSTDLLAMTYNSRGRHYYIKGDYDNAIIDFNQALRLRSDVAQIYNNRGNAYARKGDYAKASADLTQALKLRPFDEIILMNRAYVLLYAGQFGESANDFRHIAEARPGDPYLALWLALTEQRSGQDGLARLKIGAARLDLDHWPGPIVRLFIGQIGPGEFAESVNRAAVSATSREDHDSILCEGVVFLAMLQLLEGLSEAADGNLDGALRLCSTTSAEHYVAKSELERRGAGFPR